MSALVAVALWSCFAFDDVVECCPDVGPVACVQTMRLTGDAW